jgi:flavin reductase (DIM6/NTAB) family NADH-FMN oxidoreductase RutF
MSTIDVPLISRETFRHTMRQLANSVGVLTTWRQGALHGMTATAWMPLSLEPPLLLVCINQGSDTELAMREATFFGINLLSTEQTDLAMRFAGRGQERYQLDDLERCHGPNGAVFFPGYAAALEMRLTEVATGGDHTIFIGAIVWADVLVAHTPLLHHQGGFCSLSPLPREDAQQLRRAG